MTVENGGPLSMIWWDGNNISNAMTSHANQFSLGDEEQLANMINSTFQSVSASLPKLNPTHQHPRAPIPDKYQVTVDEVDKKLFKHDVKESIWTKWHSYLDSFKRTSQATWQHLLLLSLTPLSERDSFPILWSVRILFPYPKLKVPSSLIKI